MRQMSCNPQFLNKEGTDLIEGKIHTIRKSYKFWKRLEGKDIVLFTWEGRPYGKGSKKKVFCVKRVVSVQKMDYSFIGVLINDEIMHFRIPEVEGDCFYSTSLMAKNDGFDNVEDFISWFAKYPEGEMAVIHFTDFRY